MGTADLRTAAVEFWLDIGSGIEAEHWSAAPGPPGVRRVALEPLVTAAMVESGRLPRLEPGILRVGGEVRPEGSLEGMPRSCLPFRDESFTYVHCGFLLHLYLEILPLLAEESHRVLRPGGVLEVLLPHFWDNHSERNLQHTEAVLRERFGSAELTPFEGPYTTFWADLYRSRTFRIRSRKRGILGVGRVQ